ncbi:glycosyltransferase family 2 protein [Candidatus Woesearchaeota archaeon]|nr:glycosyltransferase family 2 protein [Candidatus Woesearchaeota archaeon]
MEKLVVCIVNWNTKDLLTTCLQSLTSQKTKIPFSIRIIDNASTDGSQNVVRKFPTARLIRNAINTGMAAGLNQIMQASPAEYYLFLHPDTELAPDVIEKMVPYLDNHPEIAMAGPHLRYPNGDDFASKHRFPTIRAIAFELLPVPLAQRLSLHGVYLRSTDYRKEADVDIIASACCFVRKKALDEIGLLDERFTNWMAEWDLCARLKAKGWVIRYAPLVTVVHYEGQATVTGDTMTYKRYAYVIAEKMLNSLFLFYRKHYSRGALLGLKMAVICGLLGRTAIITPKVIFPSTTEDARARMNHYLHAVLHTITH